MRVDLDLPDEIARKFADDATGVARAAAEALAIEGMRTGKLTTYEARQLLGSRSRYEMDGFLKASGVCWPATLQDAVADSETALLFSK